METRTLEQLGGSQSWGARLWPACAYQFLMLGSVALMKPSANALLLTSYPPSMLPVLYLVGGVTSGFLAVGSRPWLKHIGPSGFAFLGSAITLGCALLLQLEWKPASIAAYLSFEVLTTQIALTFWNALGNSFDAREARRAFAWINGIGMCGAVLFGLATTAAAQSVGLEALLTVGAVAMVVSGILWRWNPQQAPRAAPEVPKDEPSITSTLIHSTYARWLALLVFGFAAIQILVDYAYRVRSAETFDRATMVSWFASQQAVTGIACVVFQLALSRRLLSRLGTIGYVRMLPIALGLTGIAALFLPGVLSASALKVVESATSWSLLPVAMQLLYAPLPDLDRDRVRRTVDGLIRKVAMVIGAMILAIAGGANVIIAILLVIAVSVFQLFTLRRVREHYVEAVQARVSGEPSAATASLDQEHLSAVLTSPGAEWVLGVVEILDRNNRIDVPEVRLLLAHANAQVRARGVAIAGERKLVALAREVELHLERDVVPVQREAAWALASLAPAVALAALPKYLTHPSPMLVAAAMGALLRIDPRNAPAHQMLQGFMPHESPQPIALRREVAEALGRLPAFGRYEQRDVETVISRLLDDVDPTTRKNAITAAGNGGHLGLALKLFRFLGWRDERVITRDALAKLGPAALPILERTLDDRSRPRALRLQLPRIVRSIGGQAAVELLVNAKVDDDPAIEFRVMTALVALHEQSPVYSVSPPLVVARLERFRARWYELVETWADVRAALGDESLLTRLLDDRLAQLIEMSFSVLSLIHDPFTLRKAHVNLMGSDRSRRAWAMELLEHLLSEEERSLVLPQVEPPHFLRPPGDVARFANRLESLCEVEDVLLRTCARRVARRRGYYPKDFRADDMNEQMVGRLFALEGVDIFAQSQVDDVAAVAAVTKERSFRAGEHIYAEGDPGDALYVIIDGQVQATFAGERVMSFRARQTFGESSLFDGAPRNHDAIAVADTSLLVIDRRDFLDLLADRPELLAGVFRVVSRQLMSMAQEVAMTRRAITGDPPALEALRERLRGEFREISLEKEP